MVHLGKRRTTMMFDGVHDGVDATDVQSNLRGLHPRRPEVACPYLVLKKFSFPSDNHELRVLQNIAFLFQRLLQRGPMG